MTSNLIFPIGFDLESGVQDAIKKSDDALRQVQAAMNRKPIVLRAEVDANKFQMFSRQFTNSIDGISAKLAQAQRIWNSMSLDVKFDSDGNLSRRAQVVFDAFQQLTQASATMGQRLGEVNRNLAKSEQDTARAITAEYDKRQRQINEQIRLKERQAAAEERVRQGQLKGVNVGYVETQRQVEAVRNLRLQYEALLPMLNAMAQRRYDIKVGIDKQFEADIQRINASIALRQSNLQLGAKGDTNAIQANLQAIRQLEAELQRISQQKIDLLNSNKINSDLARLRTEISSVFGELQSAERRLASDNSLNAALDAQSQKVLKLHADIQRLDQQFAQLNATGKAYNQDGTFTAQANTLLQQRIALTKQLEQEAITGQQAQIKLEQQLREEKRQTEQAAKNAAKEAERQAKSEMTRRQVNRQGVEQEQQARRALFEQKRAQWQKEQQILNKEAKSIADITAKLQIQQQRLRSADIGSAKFNKIAEEVRRLTADLEKANQKMRELTGQTQSGAARQSAAVRQVGQEFKNQGTYLSRLIQRMAAYASFSAIGGLLTSIREVTAEFELQRVALGAIIQDQTRANQLFSEIKAFALESPMKILDLTKYTKQLAAYNVETDELFDTTKRLADVSVGLGVSMDRLILAYGQVRATGYLRASEVRQFTEAGLGIVEELAKKLTEANGELVRASDVMDMISKREIPFEMVAEVFDDLTSKGGRFYDMQVKQGNTLYGMWQKLGDAAAIMYNEMGKSDLAMGFMEGLISVLRSLMLNWKRTGVMLGIVAAAFGKVALSIQSVKLATATASAANVAYVASLRATNAALQTELASNAKGNIMWRLRRQLLIKANAAQIAAATSNNILARSFYKLKAAMLSNPWTMVAMAVASVVAYIMMTEDATDKLADSLEEINTNYADANREAASNIKILADKAVEAADGSAKQKEALDELSRTYGNIIPQELLTIENLRAMKGEYGELTAMVEEYNNKMKYEEQKTAVKEAFAEDIKEQEKNLRDLAKSAGATAAEIQEFLLDVNEYVGDYANLVGKTTRDVAFDVLSNTRLATRLKDGVYFVSEDALDAVEQYLILLKEQNDALGAVEQQFEDSTTAADLFRQELDKALSDAQFLLAEDKDSQPHFNIGIPGNENEYGTQDMLDYAGMIRELNTYIDLVKERLEQAGVEIEDAWFQYGEVSANGIEQFAQINHEAILKALGVKDPELSQAIKQRQETFENFAPSDKIRRHLLQKFIAFANATEAGIFANMKVLYKGDESLEDYKKRLKESLDDLSQLIARMRTLNMMIDMGWANGQKYTEEDFKKAQEQADLTKKMFVEVSKFYPDQEKKTRKARAGSKQQDPRLQILNEMVQLAEKLNKEYSDWEKKVGRTKALEKVNATYEEMVKYAEKAAKEAGISLPHLETPTNAKELNEYLEAVRKEMETAKGLKGGKKAAIELALKMSNNVSTEDQKAIEEKIKALADRISRTKTAKEFYDKVLGMTGDVELAANVAIHVYGEQGKDLNKQIREQIEKLLEPSGIKIDESIFREDGTFDPKKLREFAESQKDAIGGVESKAYQELIKLSDNADKDFANTIEGWLKAIEKAKSASDKMLDLARETRTEIDKITAQKGYAQTRITELLGLGTRTDEQQQELEHLQSFLDVADKLIQGFKDKQMEEQTSLTYEMFKDSPMYVQMFDDLDHASTAMLENMKTRIEGLKGAWKDLTPTQLKELQSRMNEIDAQLAKRNPFKALAKSISDYRKLRSEGDSRGNKSEGAANADLMAASKVADEARKKYDELVKKYGEGSEKSVQEVIDAKDDLDRAMANEEAAQKAVENWKKVKDMIGLSANELFQMMNWGADIARGIAGISEAMGADEEDVQYWNDVADALGNISGGIQDIVSAAMSGNVTGIISSTLTAIPKMIAGFTNLFSAGKVKKANKEIKRQQKILEQLEYTYGRLEAAADKVFGRDYLNNYDQQLQNLQAQQTAYLKQAEAERSKGKKADEEKIKEYENQARETADKIKELQDDLVPHFTGSSKTDAARQMAQSWVEARASMSDTFAAIKGDYQDLIKNMIVEGAAARVIENALSPMWDSMEEMLEKNDVDGAIDSLVNGMDSALNAANDGMEVLWEALEARGYDMKSLISDVDSEYTGIAKDVAGATSEEINNVAAIGNTLMYYVSPIPRIDENLAAIRAIMERGGTSAMPQSAATTGWTDWQQQAMDNYQAIARNTAETVVRCERAAVACEKMARAITTKGATSGFNVFMNK